MRALPLRKTTHRFGHVKSRPAGRKARPRLENLEERTLPSVSVVEPFESDLSTYRSALHFIPNADITEAAAHDGLQGLDKHDGYEWLVSTDLAAHVGPGMTVSVWVQFHDVADGRAYFGFGSAPAGLNQNSGSGHTMSLVLAPNTHQLMFENNSRLDSFAALGGAVSQDYDPDTWYRVEVVWAANGSLTGNLYDSTGVHLINSVHATASGGAGGIAFRAFGPDKYFDTVVVDSDSTATPQDIVDAGGGLDPNWMPTDPPPPLQNGPSDGQTPIPWDYTSTPGTGRDIALQEFDQLIQVPSTGFIDDGTGTLWVVLAGQNTSHNVGTVGVDWGPSFGGGATPMLAQYIFRQRPGESTQLLGVPADVKHFFAPDVLGPGQSDTYGSGLNYIQDLMTPGSELDPVTGRLNRASYSATMNVDGVDVHQTMSYGPLDHRLRVPEADLDPSQNPPGTRWFLMGNIFVEGDQDVSNNSRWVEITPHLNGQQFTFTYPNGSTGQFDFRTIPGLVEAPFVERTTPSGATAAPVATVRITFNTAIDPTTFTPAQVHVFAGPNGDIPVTAVTPVDDTDTQFDVSFDPQTTAGAYAMVIGPDIDDFNGNAMASAYTIQFSILAPAITQSSPTGDVGGTIDHVTVTFNEPIDPSAFSPAQVHSFTGPNGDIPVNDVQPTDGTDTTYVITFDAQTTFGAYSMTIGPDIYDAYGNGMTAPYAVSFSIVSNLNLVINGGFEDGDTGWVDRNSVQTSGFNGIQAHGGTHFLALGAVGGDAATSQTIATVAGQVYVLEFFYYRDGGTPSDLNVYWDGGTAVYAEGNRPAHDWEQHDVMVTGTGSDTLTIAGRNDPSWDAIDDLSLRPTDAPGPSGQPSRDATLAGSMPRSSHVSASPVTSAPGAISTEGPFPNWGQTLAVPAKPLDTTAISWWPAAVLPTRDPLGLMVALDGLTL